MGFISLFADIVYEGARGISGPLLATLGASGLTVGLVAGGGELLGYGLRLFTGVLADRTRRYWTFLALGYGLSVLSVPLLALATRWETAALLLLLERTGKAIRSPSRDVLLSSASSHVGRGWGFGLHEAMDQIGALAGPLIMAWILARTSSYPTAFTVLAVPAACTLSILAAARFLYPAPADFEPEHRELTTQAWPKVYWLYLAAAGLMAFGFTDFSLVAFHLKRGGAISDATIPVLYAVAMGVDAAMALLFGKLYDRIGPRALIPAAVLTMGATPLLFFGGFAGAIAGMSLWGAAMGAHESILRAAVAAFVPRERRGAAYGLFHTGYGLLWFAGSAVMGFLYDRSLAALVVVSVLAQIGAVAILCRRELRPAYNK